MDHRKLFLTRVLWADPYKTIYHFKAYRLQNSIIFFFYHNYHKDHNWGDRENYSCVFNTFVRACILLFRQTMFGKWISNYCAKKNRMADCRLKSTSRVMSFSSLSGQFSLLAFTLFIISQKMFQKSTFGHTVFFFNFWYYSVPT